MKTAVCGVWHVHAGDYTKRALALGEVLGFWEEDDSLAEQFQSVFPIHRFGSLEELLASDAEGVIVCTATSQHIRVMPRIAKAGKHIFTEKVLALTGSDCEAIEKAVEEAGVSFMISLPHKTFAPHRALKAVVDSGELGKINYLRFRNCHSGSTRGWLPVHFYNAEQCGGGAMIDLGAHGMYLTHWILGMPLTAKSAFTVAHDTPKNIDSVEDNAVTVMTFESGAIALNETGFVSEHSPLVLEVSGEKGYVKMEGKTVVKCSTATEGKTEEVPQGENLPLPIDQFVTGKPLPGFGMAEAKALTKLMEMAYAGR
ncbi:MAG: Gfo/Idh/MocA family oxidoreductase [Oscillospiraceae bacterium]|nr:Gfo/Idh/MocA family oxidoreductase [Oscillospiraceae bacterium]